MRQGISTRYIGPSNIRGGRIKAIARKRSSLGPGLSLTQPYTDDSSDKEHARAAKTLAAKLGWAGLWVGGGKPEEDGNHYVNLGTKVHPVLMGEEDSDWFVVPARTAEAENWFHVTVEYQTHGGSLGSWSGPVFGTWDNVQERGEEIAVKARRSIAKIHGGSVSAYPDGYVPAKTA